MNYKDEMKSYIVNEPTLVEGMSIVKNKRTNKNVAKIFGAGIIKSSIATKAPVFTQKEKTKKAMEIFVDVIDKLNVL